MNQKEIEKYFVLNFKKNIIFDDEDSVKTSGNIQHDNPEHESNNNTEENEYKINEENYKNYYLLTKKKSIQNKDLYINQKYYNNGSLYDLFNSDIFDMHLLMFYLGIKEESSIIDLLVNIIYSKCINQSLFYIPQLCFLISNKTFYESIENYVLDRCVDQLKFSLKAHWLLGSFIEHDDPYVVKKFDKFIQRVEMTLVYGRRATISNYRIYNTLNKKTEEDVVLNSLDKEFRLEYFDKIMKFYNDLRIMCEKLKKYPKEDKINPKLTRFSKMKEYLKRFNKKLKDLFKNIFNQKNSFEKEQQNIIDEKILEYKYSSKSLIFFRGYMLPFDDNISTVDDYSTLIVNFLPEYSFCFSTKARVPVKITVETIKVFEAEFWDDLILKDEDFHSNNHENQGNIIIDDDGKSISTKFTNLENGNYYINYFVDKSKKDYIVVEFNSLEDFFKKIENENKETYNSNALIDQKEFDDKNNKEENTELNDNLNESNLITITDYNDKEENIVEKYNQENIQELSNIIQQENNPLSSRNKNLEVKINSYRKSVINIANVNRRKNESFLAEDSPTVFNPFGRKWSEIENEIKENSKFKNFETYEIKSFIAKADDDLRQELMTMQLIKRFDDIFKKADIPLKLKPYEILITSPSSGLIEFIPNTISIDGLKKKIFPEPSLNIFFRKFFITNFEEAQKNFAESLAAYSIVQYILCIRDR